MALGVCWDFTLPYRGHLRIVKAILNKDRRVLIVSYSVHQKSKRRSLHMKMSWVCVGSWSFLRSAIILILINAAAAFTTARKNRVRSRNNRQSTRFALSAVPIAHSKPPPSLGWQWPLSLSLSLSLLLCLSKRPVDKMPLPNFLNQIRMRSGIL